MMLLGLVAACSSSVTTGPDDTSSGGGGGGSTSSTGGSAPGTGGGGSTSTGAGGASTSTSSGATGGGAPFEKTCFSCSSACYDPLYACQGDAACKAWAACATPCFQQNLGPSCWKTCNEQHPGVAEQYGAIYACLCQSCASECGDSVDPCNQN